MATSRSPSSSARSPSSGCARPILPAIVRAASAQPSLRNYPGSCTQREPKSAKVTELLEFIGDVPSRNWLTPSNHIRHRLIACRTAAATFYSVDGAPGRGPYPEEIWPPTNAGVHPLGLVFKNHPFLPPVFDPMPLSPPACRMAVQREVGHVELPAFEFALAGGSFISYCSRREPGCSAWQVQFECAHPFDYAEYLAAHKPCYLLHGSNAPAICHVPKHICRRCLAGLASDMGHLYPRLTMSRDRLWTASS